ncbi:hypothetical protein J3R30DRAFT_3700334 [Lentinula aciculospora]|uniref:ChrR-like cupin domain-containing protein n=1 Tax=Lentinula aciculospora TaxID=153920 RepID=A0A9W9AEF3_9AGAR|nr:hypothetical protein J3R30DRAFT_3700334 [Lentinula aciculospora]
MQQKEFSSLPPRPKLHASAQEASPWYSVGPGIWEYSLNSSEFSSATFTAITHDYIEEVIVLEGGLRDLTLQQEWGPGAYAYRLPGMNHGPYKASKDGCLEFVRCVSVTRGKIKDREKNN